MFWFGLLLLFSQKVVAWEHTDDDLMSFVTVSCIYLVYCVLTCTNHVSLQLPDVRAVKFDVQYQDRDRVAPGYWFVSPYLHIAPDEPTSLYEQYQTGPHIYDQDGVRLNLCILPKEVPNSSPC